MLSIPWLDDTRVDQFPGIATALKNPNGLLAAGGDLSSTRLKNAYRAGIFPWYSEGEPILWWSPDPRCVLFPSRLRISGSMKKRLKQNDFRITIDQQFESVIEACSSVRRESQGTWINEEMKSAYIRLHQEGIAHSVECLIDNRLVGGLYGISLGKCFFGESMFSRVSNSSKLAFIALVRHLGQRGVELIDCQVTNDHLISLGAEEIPRSDFARLLEPLVKQPLPAGLWQPECFRLDTAQ